MLHHKRNFFIAFKMNRRDCRLLHPADKVAHYSFAMLRKRTKKNPESTKLPIRDIPFLSTELVFSASHHPRGDMVYFICSGRSSDFRIILLTAPSRQSIWILLPVTFCSVRPRLQRRARPRISRGSLLSSV